MAEKPKDEVCRKGVDLKRSNVGHWKFVFTRIIAAAIFIAVLPACTIKIRMPIRAESSAVVVPPGFGILNVSPANGRITGGQELTITGTALTATTTVTIDGRDCTSVVFASETTLTCTSPEGWPGAREVVVTDAVTSDSANLSDGFSYDPQRLSLVSKNLGTSATEEVRGFSVDASGNAWVGGLTVGNFGGGYQGGAGDGFIAKYDSSGALLFSKNQGTNNFDSVQDVGLDSSGNAWVAGVTYGNFGGGNQGGAGDAFIAKYDSLGTLLFSRNLGTSGADSAQSLALDSGGNIWISGYTSGNFGGGNQGDDDVFIAKFDSSGTLLFSKNLGTSSAEIAQSIALDSSGNAWIAGYTNGNFGGGNQGSTDAFIAKYDSSGTLLFSKNLGTGSGDLAASIDLDSSDNAWLVGQTAGNLGGGYQGGSYDAFIAKFDASGALLFSKNLGTTGADSFSGISFDTSGDAWLSGTTSGNFGGGNLGGDDGFIAKYDSSGTLLFSKNFGTHVGDYPNGISLDASGNPWLSGTTSGNFGGGNQGNSDAFLFRLPLETLGPTESSAARGIANRPAGGTSVVGETAGDFGGGFGGDTSDAFFQIYDSAGDLTFSVNFGTTGVDAAKAVAVDSSNVSWIVGETTGSFSTNVGNRDAFIAKFSQTGTQTLASNFGTAGDDTATAIVGDGSGNFYVTGYTNGDFGNGNSGADDAFIAKFDSTGALIFSNNFGTASNDRGNGILIDGSGDVWISGYTDGDFGGTQGGRDAFLVKFNSAGVLQSSMNLGTGASDEGTAISQDSNGNIFIAGATSGDFGNGSLGNQDAFLAKFNGSGALQFAKNFGSDQNDTALSVQVNSNDEIFLVGETQGAMGLTHIGQTDGFVAKFDVAGNYRGADNYGSALDDSLYGLSISSADDLFVVGQSTGAINGRNANNNGQLIFAKAAPRIPPTQVLNLVATAGAAQVSLSWDASDDTTRYLIQRSDDGGATWTTISTNTTGTTYVDTAVTPGTTYDYTVTAYNVDVAGAPSATSSATPTYLAPIVTSLDVVTGPIIGGTVINITGQYFESDATVNVGGNACTGVVYNSDTSLTCTTPAGISGGRIVSVTNVAQAVTGSLADAFTYDPDPGFVKTVVTSQNLGTGSNDRATGIATDVTGNVWVTGYTSGDFGSGNQGGEDAFIAKYDSSGALLFSKNLGTASQDQGTGISIDSFGNAWVVGTTSGNLGGGNQGIDDVYIAKYDTSGALLFSKNLGTGGNDTASGIAIDDSGNAWVTGWTTSNFGGGNQGDIDAFIAKYDTSGALLFSKNLGTSDRDQALSIALDGGGNAWVTGWTAGNLGGGNQGLNDAFIAKYDTSGTLLFSKNLSTSGDEDARGIALDGSGNAWITGVTDNNFGGGNAGAADAFIAKYDTSGALLFSKNLGTIANESANSIAVDGNDNIWVTGTTSGDLGGGNQGGDDAIIAKYDTSGALLFSKNLGTGAIDAALSISLESSGKAWIAGITGGDFGGGNQGNFDAFITNVDLAFDIANVSSVPPDTAEYRAVAKDFNGNLYTVGITSGNLGDGNSGNSDVVIAKYTATTGAPDVPGALIWSKMIGTTSTDTGYGVAVDSAGALWVTGATSGNMGGGMISSNDAFIAKLDATTGAVTFQKNFGTVGDDVAYAIATDSSNNAIVVGSTNSDFGNGNSGGNDAFVVKFDSSGTLIFNKNIGSTDADVAYGVAIDGSDRIFVTGGSAAGTISGYSGPGAFIGRYDSSGNFQVGQNISLSSSNAIAIDGSAHIWIAGLTAVDLGNGFVGGATDAFVAKLDSNLNLLFQKNIGTASTDEARDLDVNSADDAFVFGHTGGDFGNGSAGGPTDTFMSKIQSDGTILYSKNTGSTATDNAFGGILDANDQPWIVGSSDGDLGDGNSGQFNAFILKVRETLPPPQILSLTFDASVAGTVTLNWNASQSATTYTISRSDDGGVTSNVIATGIAGITYNDTTVIPGSSYQYTVTPYNGNLPGADSPAASTTSAFYNPIVTSLDVTSGPIAGGTSITITGQYFESDATVTVGGRACASVVFNSATSLTCSTPIGFSGSRTVAVTNVAQAVSGSLADAFTYDETPGFMKTVVTSQNLGTGSDDTARSIVTDISGNLWITGETYGNFGGGHQGDSDAFIAKYDNNGALLFSKNLGTGQADSANCIAVDTSGNAWIAGYTEGSIGGPNQGGAWDTFISKYDSSGTLLFSKNLGTSLLEVPNGIAVDPSGNVWITGVTSGDLGGGNQGNDDGFIAKYDTSGTLLFSKNIGTSGSEQATSIAIDGSGNAWIAGFTSGNLGGGNQGSTDSFIAKYDTSGSLLFSKNLGTSSGERAYGIAIEVSGNAWVTGYTNGNFGGGNRGSNDAFIAKFDSAGNLLFSKNLGTSGGDGGQGIALDSGNNVWIAGSTNRDFGGGNQGSDDAFIAKFDSAGALLYSRNLGTGGFDLASGIAIDSTANVFITGTTNGNLGGGNQGNSDAFIAKINPVFDMANVSAVPPDTASYRNVTKDGAGNLYAIGTTTGNLGDGKSGSSDVVIAKYNATTGTPGTLIWSQQIGTSATDGGYGIAVDSAGSVWVTGSTEGNLGGGLVGGTVDAFIVKIDTTTGAVIFKKNFGTTGDDVGYAISTDSSNNAIVVGATSGNYGNGNAGGATDAFIAKFDSSGSPIFQNNIGSTEEDVAYSVAIDGSDKIYVSGASQLGTLSGYPGTGAFIGRYDSSGIFEVGQNIASSESFQVRIDAAANVWIAGSTTTNLGNGFAGGAQDAFIAKYDSSLTPVFQKNIGTGNVDSGTSLDVNSTGDAFLFGFSDGNFGNGNVGLTDTFMTKVKSDGTILFSKNTGSTGDDYANSGILDLSEKPWIVGSSNGDLGDGNSGQPNAFILKVREVLPPPAVLSLSLDNSVGGTITLNWLESQSATTYTITRTNLSDMPITDTIIATGVVGATYSDTTVIPGSNYVYTITPYNGNLQGSDWSSNSVTAIYRTPIVTSLDVPNGDIAGGTLINITGNYFDNDATVTVGARACTGITVNSPTSITCTTPTGISGTRDVVVTNPTSTFFGTGADLFTYDSTAPGEISAGSATIGLGNFTAGTDSVAAITMDGDGAIVVVGITNGNMGGGYQGGASDGFVSFHNSVGTITNSFNVGGTGTDTLVGAVQSANGNVWAVGTTDSNMGGGYQGGGSDAFLVQLSSGSASPLYAVNFGTNSADTALGIAQGSDGAIYVAVQLEIGGVRIYSFDAAGNAVNFSLILSPNTVSLAVDAFNRLLAVDTDGPNVVVYRFDSSLTLLGDVTIYSGAFDRPKAIATDTLGNAWIVGVTNGSLGSGADANQGLNDAFLIKLDQNLGTVIAKNIGSAGEDAASGITVNAFNQPIITGVSGFDIQSGLPITAGLLFTAKFDDDGSLLATHYLDSSMSGSPSVTYMDLIAGRVIGVKTDTLGNVWTAGTHNTSDAFLVGYEDLNWSAVITNAGSSFATGIKVAIDSNHKKWVLGDTASGDMGGRTGDHGDLYLAQYSSSHGSLVQSDQLYFSSIGSQSSRPHAGLSAADFIWVGAGNVLQKFSKAGALIATYNTIDSGLTGIKDVAAKDDYVWVLGQNLIAKFASDGTKLIETTFVPASGQNIDLSISVDSDGSVWTSSSEYISANPPFDNFDFMIRKFNSSGVLQSTTQWEQSATNATDSPMSIAANPLGGVWASGFSLLSSLDGLLARIDSSNSVVSHHRIQTSGNTEELVYGVAVDAGGYAWAVGYTTDNLGGGNFGGYDAFIRKLDPLGRVVFSRNFGTAGTDLAVGVAVDANGVPWVTGKFGPNFLNDGDTNGGVFLLSPR